MKIREKRREMRIPPTLPGRVLAAGPQTPQAGAPPGKLACLQSMEGASAFGLVPRSPSRPTAP